MFFFRRDSRFLLQVQNLRDWEVKFAVLMTVKQKSGFMDKMNEDKDVRVAQQDERAGVPEGDAPVARALDNGDAPVARALDNGDAPVARANSRRAAWAERYRTANPDAPEDIDDETLYGYADDEYTSGRNAYDELNSAQDNLVNVIHSDPEFASVVALVAKGQPFGYAVGKIIGNPEDALEGKDLDDYRRGKAERDAEAAAWAEIDGKRNENLQLLLSNIEAFGKENGLTEEDTGNLRQSIVEELYGSLMNEYSKEAIGQKWKGLNYDRDVTEAARAGEAAARNAKIVAKKKTLATSPAAGLRTAPQTQAGNIPSARNKHVDFFREMKDAQ